MVPVWAGDNRNTNDCSRQQLSEELVSRQGAWDRIGVFDGSQHLSHNGDADSSRMDLEEPRLAVYLLLLCYPWSRLLIVLVLVESTASAGEPLFERSGTRVHSNRYAYAGEKTAAIGALGWFDRFLRAKKVRVLESSGQLFTSRNILGVMLTYFFTQISFYGIITWVPSYLLNAKGYSIMKMGWVAATPWAGGVVGNLLGGWISDNWLYGRRKPMMLVSGLGTLGGMYAIIHAPTPATLGVSMFITGILLNSSWPSYFAFPMGFTTSKTYPVAISIVLAGANVGALVSPMIGGYLLDIYKNYDVIFIFMGAAAFLSLLSALLLLDEPVNV